MLSRTPATDITVHVRAKNIQITILKPIYSRTITFYCYTAGITLYLPYDTILVRS